jgi:hypothetical protein
MKARIVNDTVVEILTAIPGYLIEDCFHSSIIAQCEDVSEEVQVGWVKDETGEFKAPEPEVLPVVAPE